MDNIQLHHEWAEPLTKDIDGAKKTVLISSLSLHWSSTAKDTPHGRLCGALAEAARRGVRVLFVLPQPTKIHPATLQNATHAGRAAVHGLNFRWIGAPRLLHAKSAVIDTEVIWIGSGNYTTAATAYNYEAYMRATSIQLAVRHSAHLLRISTEEG